MAQGRPRFRRSQSRWIASQLQQYRSAERSDATWLVLFAAFAARFPHGGVDGQPITLRHYKNHVRYLELKQSDEQDGHVDDEVSSRTHRRSEREDQRGGREARDLVIKQEEVPPARPRLLRTRATEAALAAATRTEERRSKKRRRSAPVVAVVKQEDDVPPSGRVTRLSQAERERDRLAMELKECQASLKRMKHSAHAWKVKYEELLAAMPTTTHSVATTNGRDQSFTFTMNINVDVAQNGERVRTDRHAVHVTASRN